MAMAVTMDVGTLVLLLCLLVQGIDARTSAFDTYSGIVPAACYGRTSKWSDRHAA